VTVTHVCEGGESKGREDITVGHVDVPVKVYRTDGYPPIFAGFRTEWVSGEDPDTGTTFFLGSGAGCGSEYMTITVEVPGHPAVYEYVDVTELFRQRIGAIIKELTDVRTSDAG